MTLKLLAIGGLGNMLGPSATHLQDPNIAQYLRVLDRGNAGEKKDKLRAAWRQHGATLVGTLPELIGNGDFDGIVICVGKNGDDYKIMTQLLPLLSAQTPRHPYFILHLSTVSANFVTTTYDYCAKHRVHYANYPLTGGVRGAEAGTMLILCSGDASLYTRVEPMLKKIGTPNYFGAAVDLGAAVKLIGHILVFHGLLGMSLAVALHKSVFNFPRISPEQVAFFDFLNQGAGGTRQWDFSIRPGVLDGQWNRGFLIQHAVIDIIYTARLMYEKQLPITLILPLFEVTLLFIYLLQHASETDLTTQAITRLIATTPRHILDDYIKQYLSFDFDTCMKNCINNLPEHLQKSLMLDVSYAAT